MAYYRNFFSNNNPTEPSAVLSQASSNLQQQAEEQNNDSAATAVFTPNMFDDWLVDELCKSGLMPAIETTSASPSPFTVDYITSERTSSHPASPPNSVVSDEKSGTAGPTISLFPNIQRNQAVATSPILPHETISSSSSSAAAAAAAAAAAVATASTPAFVLSPITPTTPTETTFTATSTRTATTTTPSPHHHLPRLAPRPSMDRSDPVIKAPIAFSLSGSQQKRQHTANGDNSSNSVNTTAVEMAIKRQRNTDAARRSRLKKLVKMEQLEKRVAELETENQGLSTRIAVLESEKKGLSSKDDSHEERIRALEAQLTEAYKALTNL